MMIPPPPPGDMYRAAGDNALVSPSAPGSTDSDYWHGDWYNDIKAMVYTVALAMHDHGVDPTLIQAEDAWAHMAGNIRAGHAAMESRGMRVPQEFRDFVKADGAGGRVFQAMWQFYDLRKLIERGVGGQL